MKYGNGEPDTRIGTDSRTGPLTVIAGSAHMDVREAEHHHESTYTLPWLG